MNHNPLALLLLSLVISFALTPKAKATVLPVVDYFNNITHVSNLTELIAVLEQTVQYVELAGKMKAAIGDPMAMVGLLASDDIAKMLDSPVLAKGMKSLGNLATATELGAELYGSTSDLFTPIDFSGYEELGGLGDPKKYSDPRKAYNTLMALFSSMEEGAENAEQLKKELAALSKKNAQKINASTSDAEVQRLGQEQTMINNQSEAIDRQLTLTGVQTIATGVVADQTRHQGNTSALKAVESNEAVNKRNAEAAKVVGDAMGVGESKPFVYRYGNREVTTGGGGMKDVSTKSRERK